MRTLTLALMQHAQGTHVYAKETYVNAKETYSMSMSLTLALMQHVQDTDMALRAEDYKHRQGLV